MMNIQFPRLKKCCCCLPLRVGSLIIGYSSIVFSFLFLSVVSFSLYKVITYVETHEDVPDAEHTPEDIKRIGQSLYITHAYLILVYLYYLIINLFLVIGIHMNKTLYMKTYFNSGLFLIILALATVVVSTVFLHFIATVALLKWCALRFCRGVYLLTMLRLRDKTIVEIVVVVLHVSVIIFYCLLVVRSAYLEIEERNKPRDFEMQNLYITHRAPLLL